jgi:hypothetical protein
MARRHELRHKSTSNGTGGASNKDAHVKVPDWRCEPGTFGCACKMLFQNQNAFAKGNV